MLVSVASSRCRLLVALPLMLFSLPPTPFMILSERWYALEAS